ncbi:DUF4314 domain-containing protein [Actinomyces minihominis]|uniref:DUF4314 domain-containing protein n=1 Tax=Actinomyces minihominis TaxID=2002838 RepID=UPI000C07FA0C|nr:DUF4314 domain-containing protein [Actinomyces minihominis]
MSAKRGQRVRLVYTSDPYSDLLAGSEGTVMFVDALGTVHVAWDSGSTLGLIPGEDKWEVTPNSNTIPRDIDR